MVPRDYAEELNGRLYFTVQAFALVTKKSQQSIRFLMAYGNRIRKLRVEYIFDKPLIPYEELTEFPFTLSGRNSKSVYHYNEAGEQIPA
jgi:hypothetical protein